jgi:hypothetical protein
METITIAIRNPKVRPLLADLVNLDLISIVAPDASWRDRWQTLSASLPDTDAVSEQDILDEIDSVRQGRS